MTFWQGKVLNYGFGQGEDVVMNSHYQVVDRIPGGNGLHADLHEFQIAPHDIAFITAYNPIRCNLAGVQGPRDGAIIDTALQEIDMKTGLVRWEWHSLDHLSVNESQTSPPRTRPWDWFHLNSIDPEPDGDLLISARSTWAAYQLEGGSGKILWRLGGLNSSFTMGPGTETAWQHDGRMLPDGEVTLLRRRLQPARPRTVPRGADQARLQDPRSDPERRLQAPTRRCSRRARATCRRSRAGTSWSPSAGCPRSASIPGQARCSSTPTYPSI